MESLHLKPVFNLFFVGSSGSGRSSTCNTLYENKNQGPFQVINDEVSCNIHTANHVQESKRIRLIDTPGFGDSRIEETKTTEILKQLALHFLNSTDQSNNLIHAFVLVVKIDIHYSTLESDIHQIQELFGRHALKSLIILPISSQKIHIEQALKEQLNRSNDAFKLLKTEKGRDFHESWYCLWDNKQPYDHQEYRLIEKIKNLQPYTSQHFAQATIRHQEKMKIQQSLDLKLQKYEEQEEQVHAKKSKVDIEEILASIEDINQSTRLTTQQLYEQMKKDINETTDEFLEMANTKHNLFHPSLDAFINDNKKILKRMEAYLQESLEKQEVAEERNLSDLFWTIVKSHDKKLTSENAKELTGLVAKKGAEKLAEKGAAHIAKKVVIFGATKICNIF